MEKREKLIKKIIEKWQRESVKFSPNPTTFGLREELTKLLRLKEDTEKLIKLKAENYISFELKNIYQYNIEGFLSDYRMWITVEIPDKEPIFEEDEYGDEIYASGGYINPQDALKIIEDDIKYLEEQIRFLEESV